MEFVQISNRAVNQMTTKQDRFTTEYIETEDRIRLSIETATQASAVIWLSQRLMQRLVPVLLQWLEQQGPREEVLQNWAQQAARSGIRKQAPVKANTDGHSWLAHSIDVKRTEQAVVLTFKGPATEGAILTLTAEPLRQWLNIVYDSHIHAGWSLAIWPEWISQAKPIQSSTTWLH